MQLTEHPYSGAERITGVGHEGIRLRDQVWRQSFYLRANETPIPWDVASVQALTEAHMAPLLALMPQVILLGTGARLVFPDQAVRAACLTRHIGLEAMDNHAAARTFNVLLDEGRDVVVAFIL